MPPIDELSLQHLHHLATIREDLLLYVALPFGWSFAVLDDDERSWAAFSPADQVRGYIRDFLAGDTSTSTAEAIKDIVEESFAESPIASLLSRSLGRYVAVGSELDDLRALLQTAQAELVGDAVR